MSKKMYLAVGVVLVIAFVVGNHIYKTSLIPGYWGGAETSTTTIFESNCEIGRIELVEELYVNTIAGSHIRNYLVLNGQRIQPSEYFFSSTSESMQLVNSQYYAVPRSEIAKAPFPTYLYRSELVEEPAPLLLFKSPTSIAFNQFNTCIEENLPAMKIAFGKYITAHKKRNEILGVGPSVMTDVTRFIGSANADDREFDKFSNGISDRLNGTKKIETQKAISECHKKTGRIAPEYNDCLREAGVLY
jgi:hypothetical protein